VIISKLDLADTVEFDLEAALNNLYLVTPKATVFELSAKAGLGMEGWYDELRHRFARLKSASK
jgi:Ni2+-binding GTPase involved in maturation of urease and hydrogenase